MEEEGGVGRVVCHLRGQDGSILVLRSDRPVIVGRNSASLPIGDKRCSRQHAELCFNEPRRTIRVTAMGSNPVLIQAQANKERLLMKTESAELPHGGVLFMLPGEESLRFDVEITETTSSKPTAALRQDQDRENVDANGGKKRKMPTTFDRGDDLQDARQGSETAQAPEKKKQKITEENAKPKPTKIASADTRPKCKYGTSCYRKNPDHLKAFSHSFSEDEQESNKEKQPSKDTKHHKKKWKPENEQDDEEAEIILAADYDNDTNGDESSKGEVTGIPRWIKQLSYTTPSKMRWMCVEETLFVLDGKDIKPSAKIASFDMDSTLIVTKSGRVFPQSRNDWQWMYSSIPDTLRKLYKSGFKIVIFTNQGGIKNNPNKAEEIKGKIADIYEDLGVPIQAFIAGGSDGWRKPSTDMWSFLCHHCNGGVAIDMDSSFYCGDAAGRRADPTEGRPKNDFSCGDRKFAANIGLNFHTPEAYFLKQREADFEWGGVNPKSLYMAARTKALIEGEKSKSSKMTSDSQELVIFVGFPASGKSTFAERYFVPKGYLRINQDTLKSKDRCVRACGQALDEGKSVVIDNTNPSAAVRAEYLALAQKRGIPARCFYFTTPRDVAKHLNYYREKLTEGERKHVPDIGYNIYTKNFQEPKPSEGFREVKRVNFVPQFESKHEERLFLQFTAE